MAQEPARARAVGLISAEVLAHVPGFAAGGPSRATRLAGGTVNASFQVETSAGRFVLRIHDPESKSLGADHEREALLHAAAAAAGLAPALVYVDPGYHFMVMQHVSGAIWAADDFARPDCLRKLGVALHALHSVAPPAVAPFDIGVSLERLYERLVAALPGESAALSGLMDRGRAALLVSAPAQRPKTAVHNDLHHTNLVGTDPLYLLDWEYGAVSDPLLDLACVLAYYPQALPHSAALLDASRMTELASAEMLTALTWVFMLVSYFWYRLRRLAGPAPAGEVLAEQGLLARLG